MSRAAVLGAGPEAALLVRAAARSADVVVFGRAGVPGLPDPAAEAATEAGIPIVDTLTAVLAHEPQVVFMASWPRLIPPAELERARFVNLHGALLPAYRGMHGGTWAIVNGERLHGYTIHGVDAGMDSGPIYYQGVVEPSLDDDVNAIRRLLLDHLATHAPAIIGAIVAGALDPLPQDPSRATYVGRRTPEDGRIDWGNPAWRVFNLVRALAPPYTPGAFTTHGGRTLHITRAAWRESPPCIATPGQVVARLPGEGVLVACGDRSLLVTRVSADGREADATDWFGVVGARLGRPVQDPPRR